MVGTNSSGNFLPSLVQSGSLALAVLATGYGASGISMWYQRDRSLVPCSLMALMR